jgi:hypothetical protein
MAELYNLNVGVFPLVGGTAGHVVIAATDARGNIIFEAQGLATGPDGQRKAIGGPLDRSDTIDAYVRDGADLFPQAVNRKVLFTGSLEDIKLYRAALEEAAVRINAKDIDYGPMGVFGANSNSVGHTFLKLLGFDMKAGQLTKKALPGFGKILLSAKEMAAIQNMELDAHCFIAGTMIDMWPLDPTIQPDANGLYDKAEVLAKVWQKPIEEISPADWVVSFDKAGNLQPGKVSRTFNNEAKIILNFFGTGVTPGHVYYRPDSKKRHKFEPLIDILRDDGVVQKGDGSLIRAATNCEVGSEDDRELWAFTVYEDKDGNECIRDKKKLRLGTRWMLPNGNHFSMCEYMQGIGLELLPNGYVRWKQTGLITPFVWTLSDTLPNPEDFVLAQSGTTLEDIYKAAEWEAMHPDMPPPMLRDSGPVQPLSQAGLTLMPRNTPLAMREGGFTGMFNRKQRKAAEAEKRQQAKGKKWLVH